MSHRAGRELAHFHRIPPTPYYGTHDAPALFVLAAARLWQWAGDPGAVRRVAPAVTRCLEWLDRHGDLDGDGLQEYRPRSGQWGYYNQSWKDAGDAVVDADGALALVTAFAGLAPDAAGRRLGVAPQLPPWLPHLHIDRLRVGPAVVELMITADGTDVRRIEGDLRVTRSG